jgi:hypothetical protein
VVNRLLGLHGPDPSALNFIQRDNEIENLMKNKRLTVHPSFGRTATKKGHKVSLKFPTWLSHGRGKVIFSIPLTTIQTLPVIRPAVNVPSIFTSADKMG